jgi:hypothetical protein
MDDTTDLKPLEAVLVAGGFDVLYRREGEDVSHASDPLKEVNEVHRTNLAPVFLLRPTMMMMMSSSPFGHKALGDLSGRRDVFTSTSHILH